jgi:monoamine oxidase
LPQKDEISRREFCRLGAAGLLCSAELSSAEPANSEDSKQNHKMEKIVVVGAGISGLAAARTLADRNNKELIVLEARERIGGRIWTERGTMGVPIELGASWIHGAGKNPLHLLALEKKYRLVETDSKPDTFWADGKRMSGPEREEIDILFRKLRDKVYDKQKSLSARNDISVRQAFEDLQKNSDLSDSAKKGIEHLIASEIENDYASTSDYLSLKYWDTVHWFKGGDWLIPDGYDQILNLLAKGLRIQLQTAVNHVEISEGQVRVSTTGGETLIADRVLITVPLGVLKNRRIKFTPELPKQKLAAIDALEMGAFDKLYLKFPECFWMKDATWIEYAGENPSAWPMFLNLSRETGEAIIVAFNVGNFARELEKKSDEEILQQALTVLRTIYGKEIPEPVATRVTRWSEDPYAFGSYSYVPVGKSPDLFDVLAEPVGNRLFFAGEACSSKDYSSAHAAFMSGLAAARKISRLTVSR